MRFTEAMLAIPSLFLLIVLAKFIGRNVGQVNIFGRTFSGTIGIVILVIGITSWMYLARIVRANVLSLQGAGLHLGLQGAGRQQPADLLQPPGAQHAGRHHRGRHPGPGGCDPDGSLCVVPGAGRAAADLHLGQHDAAGAVVHHPGAWWMWVFPSLFIVLTILCINLLGDGLRDAFDPRTARHL